MAPVTSVILLYGLVALFGALIGSFLNVCIYRLPRRESLVWPGSHCPSCEVAIAPYDNVPVVSYLLLGGRCRACREPIAMRYPLVEALNALAYAVIIWRFGWTWTSVGAMTLFSALLVSAGTDLTHRIIPDRVTLPGMAVGLVGAATVLPLPLIDAVLGIVVGGGLLWLIAWASLYVFGKEGMGGGDIKLLAMVGAFLGWKPALLTVMIGATIGSLLSIGLMAAHIIKRDQYIPFGPFLAIGAVISMLAASDILHWYAALVLR